MAKTAATSVTPASAITTRPLRPPGSLASAQPTVPASAAGTTRSAAVRATLAQPTPMVSAAAPTAASHQGHDDGGSTA